MSILTKKKKKKKFLFARLPASWILQVLKHKKKIVPVLLDCILLEGERYYILYPFNDPISNWGERVLLSIFTGWMRIMRLSHPH